MGLEEFLELSEFIAKIILIVVSIIGGVLLHLKVSQIGKSGRNYFLLGIAVFAYIFGLTRALFLYTDNITSSDPNYELLWKFGWVMSLISIMAIVMVIETYMMKTKYIFTGIGIIGVILTIILSIALVRFINAAISGVLLVDIIAAYCYVAIKSEGEPRSRALKSLFAIFLLAFGLVMDGFTDQLFGIELGVIAASVMIIALIFYLRIIYST